LFVFTCPHSNGFSAAVSPSIAKRHDIFCRFWTFPQVTSQNFPDSSHSRTATKNILPLSIPAFLPP
jgi:hypothetical protein